MLSSILAVVIGVVILGVDQFTKYYISANFVYGESVPFLKGFIDLQFIENSGSAWGMLSGKTWLLLTITVVVMLVLITFLLKYGKRNKLLIWAVSLVISGGMGNLIDRIFRGGKVVDFLHFEFFPSFPIFNIADIAVVVGAGLLILYFIIDTVKESKNNKEKAQNG